MHQQGVKISHLFLRQRRQLKDRRRLREPLPRAAVVEVITRLRAVDVLDARRRHEQRRQCDVTGADVVGGDGVPL